MIIIDKRNEIADKKREIAKNDFRNKELRFLALFLNAFKEDNGIVQQETNSRNKNKS